MTQAPKARSSYIFGHERVTPAERERRLRVAFDRLAPYYDRLCDIQSLGLHRYWRKVFLNMVTQQRGQRIVDIAGGCGEIAHRLASPDRQVIVLDSSIAMMNKGRSNDLTGVDWVSGLARELPFPNTCMDTVTCAFGIRNLTYVSAGIQEIYRVLKPGGRFYCLEVSQPWPLIRPLFKAYCRYVVPRLGALITRQQEAYDYLVESIIDFPSRKEIKDLLEQTGFVDVRSTSLTLRIACIHVSTKPA